MKARQMGGQLWWLIHKDLIVEYRSLQVWPAMFVLGMLVALVFSVQLESPASRPEQAGTMLWLATLFAGLVAVERTGSPEEQNGCWQVLLTYPLPCWMIYLAKSATNFLAILSLELLLIAMFVIVSDVPLLHHPWATFLVAVLGSAGIASVATLVSALAGGLRQRGAIVSLLGLPLLLPLVLSASEATRFIAQDDLGAAWWRWVQLLAGFAVVFTTLGMVLFDFLVEE